ncbi:hypothetical protein ENKO_100 [Klebsiella phage fENko-Kae01]|nr:hypothetical protein [Klebsiella phage fENko-Kae01]
MTLLEIIECMESLYIRNQSEPDYFDYENERFRVFTTTYKVGVFDKKCMDEIITIFDTCRSSIKESFPYMNTFDGCASPRFSISSSFESDSLVLDRFVKVSNKHFYESAGDVTILKLKELSDEYVFQLSTMYNLGDIENFKKLPKILPVLGTYCDVKQRRLFIMNRYDFDNMPFTEDMFK